MMNLTQELATSIMIYVCISASHPASYLISSHLSSLNPHPELGAFQAHLEQVMTSPSPWLALHFPWQEIRWGTH